MMNKPPPYRNLTNDQLRSIHSICESFERSLRQDQPESIEDCLEAVNKDLRQPLFHELLAIELEFRSPAMTPSLRNEYQSRFPEYSWEIAQAVQELIEFQRHSKIKPTSSPARSGPATSNDPIFAEGTRISDRYTLRHKIGEGGMGEVWVAIQTTPVERTVAIKLIKTGMDSRAVIARFEQERQALALMDHPHIARVFDAGMTSTGLPFFVMEWVDGLPLDKFCDEGQLLPAERLEIFIPICQAVQHAHQKGIIHRDLKPSNIVVCQVDGKAVPKVIDFGVAKATDEQPIDASVATQLGNVVGTLVYMSPEQAGLPDLDIDTRADIYSLGVILYELLTGLRPIDVQRLQNAGLAEMVRLIVEEEPSRPSTKLSSCESSSTLASRRGIDPRKLTTMLRGELDWVVMKCLEKDRGRRYQTANALARDIQRYLSNMPVDARPPSSGYLLQKFLRRNKGPVIAATLLVFALIAGIAGTSFGLYRADVARRDAVRAQHAEAKRAEGERVAKIEARDQAKLALESAAKEKAANTQAQKRLGQIEKSNEILGSIFRSLNPAEIVEAKRPLQVMLVEKLEAAAQQLEGDLIGDPVMVAKLQAELGHSLLALSAPQNAVGLFEKSHGTYLSELGPNHRATTICLHNLALAHLACGNLDVAIPMFKDAIRQQRDVLGPDDPMFAIAEVNLARAFIAAGNYDRGVPLLQQAVDRQSANLGPGHPETLSSSGVLAAALQDSGQPFLALEILETTLDLQKVRNGLNHPDTLVSMKSLANGYRSIGHVDKAMQLYQSAFELMNATLGENDDLTLVTMGSMAMLHKEMGETETALPLLKDRLKRTRAKFGPHHPDTLLGMSELASGYQAAGKKKLALDLCLETFEISTRELGADHPNTILGMNNLAMSHQANGDLDLALPLFQEALGRMRKKLKPRHPATLTCMGNLAAIYQDTGQIELALPLFEEALELEKAALGPGHPNSLRTMNNLAVAYWETKQLDKSVPLFRDLVDQLNSLLGPDHPNTLLTVINLGVNLKDSGQLEESIPLLEKGYRAGSAYPGVLAIAGPQLLDGYAQAEMKDSAIELAVELVGSLRKQMPQASLESSKSLSLIGLGLLNAKAFSQAEGLLFESLAIQRKSDPDSWLTFQTESLAGAALMGQLKYDDAEPLLVSGYDGMKQREESIPRQGKHYLNDALLRLIQCYEATGADEKAAIRRTELDEL